MLVEPAGMDKWPDPTVTVQVYRDPNGHYFASVDRVYRGGCSCRNTATYTTAAEAIARAAEIVADEVGPTPETRR
jgi:uncharacterized protein YqiB (DUF1249 family)